MFGSTNMKHRHLFLLLIALFLAAWLPRVLALGQFATPDESKWLARSANFYQAITVGDLHHTFQREHPGVTVMWAGTLALLHHFPDYPQETPGQFGWILPEFEEWLQANSSLTPLELLVAGRWWIVLGIALSLVVSFLPLRRLFGTRLALLALLLVIWDPFHIALSRQLHPDGLAASLSFLALTSFLAWLYGGRERRYLLLSGVTMGVAWLTKSPTILLVPAMALLLAVEAARAARSPAQPLRDAMLPLLSGFVGWGMLATATFVVCWPAMWLDPIGTLLAMRQEVEVYIEGHSQANYFWGQPTDDPGPIFYPVAYLFRATPIALIGLGLAAWWAWRRQWPLEEHRTRRAAAGLLGFAFVFALVVATGAKKFDRYLLPAFLPLDVLAALGWAGLAMALRTRFDSILQRAPALPAALVTGALFLHLLPGVVSYPYYLTYYNPLVGGSWSAPKMLMVGWGEGLDRAASWLNHQPGAEQLRVLSFYAGSPFSYFFHGTTEDPDSPFAPPDWASVDFAVLYSNQWQRQLLPPRVQAWFDARQPVHIVHQDGLELARIYDMRGIPLTERPSADHQAIFGNHIHMWAYALEQEVAAPGDEFLVTFFLRRLAPMTTDYNVLVRLVGSDGTEIWRDEGYPWGAPTSEWPSEQLRPDGHKIAIPDDAPPGDYALLLSFYDPGTFEHMSISNIGEAQPTGERERPIALIHVEPAH
ncbi:MAG: glycosyltransferase family 39 protein [Chloroflexota bacterium]|nr:glycosyltransferase family 39 protein [Chloroflexota bacterium]